jgi:hypothetical protein
MTTTSDYSNLDEKLEILIDQVALLTEAVTIGFQDFRQELAVVKEFRQDFAEIKEMIKEQSATAKEQSATTARLVKIVEALIQRG